MKINILVLCCFLLNTNVDSEAAKKDVRQSLRNRAVKKLIEYLKIDTSREENLNVAVDFVKRQAKELDLPFTKYVTKGGKPICIITLKGRDPTLPSIMLNSHMDVVPADASEWKYPPFSAHLDENGDIYARGAQDTKDIAIQYLEAIRKIMNSNVTLLRTVHVTFMPDEETGGYGMEQFVDTEKFCSLNVGFALDEGFASEAKNILFPLYQDKRTWQMEFTVHGDGGHGSILSENIAVGKAYKLIGSILDYRNKQMQIKQTLDQLDFGSYTSVNVNILKTGLAVNIIPSKVIVAVDMRLSVNSDISDVEKMVKSWMEAAGNDTEVTYIKRQDRSDKTVLDDSNPFWVAMKQVMHNANMNVIPVVCPGTTDIIHLRNRGIQAVGFAPKYNIKGRGHAINEYTNVDVFLRGIEIYIEVIKAIANV